MLHMGHMLLRRKDLCGEDINLERADKGVDCWKSSAQRSMNDNAQALDPWIACARSKLVIITVRSRCHRVVHAVFMLCDTLVLDVLMRSHPK